jgi:hypothetical protein
MTLQSGGAAKPSEQAPSDLDLDEADRLAASFRPAWEVEEDAVEHDAITVTGAPSAADAESMTAKVASAAVDPKGAMVAMDTQVDLRVFPTGSQTLDSERVREAARSGAVADKTTPLSASAVPASRPASVPPKAASVPPKAASVPPKAASVPPKASQVAADPFKPVTPSTRPQRRAASAVASAAGTEELAALVSRRSNKGLVFGVVGVVAVIGVGLFLKFAMSDDGASRPAPASTSANAANTAATNANGATRGAAEIPPPAPADEVPTKADPAKAAEPAKTEPAKTEPAKTEPAKTEPAKTEPVKAEPVKAVAPKAGPRQAVAPPPPPLPAPKTAPKPTSTGIVRDNPF